MLQSAKLGNKNFPQPILLILPCRVHYSLHGGVNVWLGPFSVLSDRILFRVLWDRVLFRVLSDRVSYMALIDKVPFRVVSNRFLYRVFIDWVLFRVLLSVLIDSILFRVLTVLVFWYAVYISCIENMRDFAMRCFVLSSGNLMQLPEIWASFWKEKKGFILDFWLDSEYTYAESLYSEVFIQRYSERFFEISRKVSLMEHFSKNL